MSLVGGIAVLVVMMLVIALVVVLPDIPGGPE
jgi:hypothetical protein